VKKELRPVHDVMACDVCGRTILKGERTEPYLAPGGQRHEVCDLCSARAQHHGWIRESVAGDMPARPPRAEPRRGVLGRLRRRRTEPPRGMFGRLHVKRPESSPEASEGDPATPRADHDESYSTLRSRESIEHTDEPVPVAPPRERPRSRPKDPRHVRAVPTTAEVKVERAIELFNGSDHQRTIAGLARTLGPPLVGARPDPSQPSEVSVVVAWELSWYRYRVDLGDEGDPVVLLEKGEELDQIDEQLRDWNVTLDDEGRVVAARPPSDGGSQE
jgi:hypothetical protein